MQKLKSAMLESGLTVPELVSPRDAGPRRQIAVRHALGGSPERADGPRDPGRERDGEQDGETWAYPA